MKHVYFFRRYLAAFMLFSLSVEAAPRDEGKVQEILKMHTAPVGVVFEIAVADQDALRWAIPRINGYVKQLREKFPGLDIAVVTHGKEQFALVRNKTREYQQVHKGVEKLVKDDKISVHICATHASWRNVEPEDFPDYVSVSATGPQQVKDYRELGYLLVKIRRR